MMSSNARAQAESVQPPRVIELPELILPEGVGEPEGGTIEAVVVVATDGSASLDECAASAELCAMLRAALPRARFEPARRGAEAIAARVRLALRVVAPDSAPPSPESSGPSTFPAESQSQVAPAPAVEAQPAAAPPDAGAPATPEPSTPAQVAPPPTAADAGSAQAGDAPAGAYGAQARVKQIAQPGMRRLELAEMRDMPGAFGDPFRAVEALPGIVPLFSGLPYIYVRGSPPTGTQYYYDGVPVPTLFHLALGPAVIHPQMVGPLKLYSGVAPARYGRLTGGAIVGEGPPSSGHDTQVEAELRLIDLSGYVQVDALGGRLAVAGRYGYPALVLSLASPEVDLAYWDYQLRYTLPVSAHDQLQLVALGSYDSFALRSERDSRLTIAFHRLEPRWLHRMGPSELGVALLLGWERSGLGPDLQVQASKLAPRAWLEHRFAGRSWLRLSADAQGTWGGLASQSGVDVGMSRELGLGGLGRGPRATLGAQAELTLRPWTALELQLGARSDAWFQRGYSTLAFDPRARLILHVSEELDFHVATGLVHQPAVAYLPLPALLEFGDLRHLQSALQSEAGVGWTTPGDFRLELQTFVHRYRNLIFSDARTLDGALSDICTLSGAEPECMSGRVPARSEGISYGLELFMRRPITHALSGFVSYTLAWSHAQRVAGQPYTPTWDVRHVGNLVLQWQLGGGYSLGLRGFFRSGKIDSWFYANQAMQLGLEQRRLPSFWRVDLELAYAWRTSWGKMRFAVEWFNATLSREPAEYQCSMDGPRPQLCTVEYLPAIFFPNLSLRAEH